MTTPNGRLPAADVDDEEAFDVVDFHFSLAEPSRREFLQIFGAGLLIAVSAGSARGQGPGGGRRGRGGGGGRGAATIAARLHIGEDGSLTLMTGKVECGQGSRAELTQAAAEELRVPAEAIRLVMADTDLVPDDGGTFGSRSTPSTVPDVRRGCAAARELLVATATKRWGVARETISVDDGKASAENHGTFSYAELATDTDAAREFGTPARGDAVLTAVDSWKVLGSSLPRPNGRDIVTGSHEYPSDIRPAGLFYGKILRRPSYGARLVSVDLKAASEMEGVTAVQDHDFVGVVAPTAYQASRALNAIAETSKWEETSHPSSSELYDYLREHTRGGVPENPFADDVSSAAKSLKQRYTVAYVQHCPMEPRAAVAEWKDGKVTVWTGTQNPFSVRGEVARAFGLADDRVRVIIPDFGGGFGGKHSGECAVEAARLAKAAGTPVRVVWTRAEEFTWAQFRPAALIEAEASLDRNGDLTSWYFVNVNSGANEIQTPYRAGQNRGVFVPSEPPLRHGSYRALATTANTFGRESFMDELALTAGRDPLDFRLAHLQPGRLRSVLEDAARRFDWKERSKAKARNVGVGLACGLDKGSFVAACVEVAVDREREIIEVRRVCQTFDCGKILNPANLRRQVSGAIMMALGPALREEMQFENGVMKNAALARYRVPRFADLPELDIHLVDNPDVPSAGAGETPLIAIAPAIANAVQAATGYRSRSMPIRLPSQKS